MKTTGPSLSLSYSRYHDELRPLASCQHMSLASSPSWCGFLAVVVAIADAAQAKAVVVVAAVLFVGGYCRSTNMQLSSPERQVNIDLFADAIEHCDADFKGIKDCRTFVTKTAL